MARPLRIDLAGGWYHVTARGIERREIYSDDRDREHFLALLEEITIRFRIRVHAYVLMSNHYHLIVETPEANLSEAMQWLNVSYAAWFNARRQRAGHLFQGRFKSVLVEDAGWAYSLSLYVHLNPVMRKAYGLGKDGRERESRGVRVATRAQVIERLRALRAYRWSSYRSYAGYAQAPDWLSRDVLLSRTGEKRVPQGMPRYRKDVQSRLRMGADEDQAEALRDAFAIGTEAFRARIRKSLRPGREVAKTEDLRKRMDWASLVKAVEAATGAATGEWMGCRGHAGRSLLLWAARRYGGMTLKEAGMLAGGMDYTAVAMRVRRLQDKAKRDPALHRLLERMHDECEM